ncbi:MAG TPA: selenocysteine-specific translation elongation factor [Dokdonella sp.]|uniref:selenocysteine-specific translation elongation factor n=1 Tax=Dokdonella sp. TaxID=2291710 RepID=UPI002BBA6665|nr:selenocysteine-specific translation elongation factor [Dokdonella sp.]HUD41720.1 selenocysteine-specific translation elongation factor [Dokdonella sp.]
MIVGTAGHIDHGKTTLVRALTGVDTDRLKEEKVRGISIELGYAYVPVETAAAPSSDADSDRPGPVTPLATDADPVLGFVDVPGHERLVHTMVAGTGGIDFALLVIAADDGVMPQTREHLAILDLLGVDDGAVALTKIDRVDPARVAEVEADVRAVLAPTVLREAPIFALDAAKDGDAGVAALRAHLHAAAARRTRRSEDGLFRLAVDRVFTLPGRGTIAAGTVHAGRVCVGDVLQRMPAGESVRVRSLHAQQRAADAAGAGQRCALNLAGVASDGIARGDWLADPRALRPSLRLDVRLRLLADATALSRQRAPLHVHVGTAHRLAEAVLLDGDRLPPGGAGRVQLVFDAPVCAAAGDRLIVRDARAATTIGGGRVLDPEGPERRRRSSERLAWLDAIERLLDGGGIGPLLDQAPHGIALDQLERLCGCDSSRIALPDAAVRVETASGPVIFGSSHWEALQQRSVAALAGAHEMAPDEAGLGSGSLRRRVAPTLAETTWRSLVDALVAGGAIEHAGAWLRLPGHRVALGDDEAQLFGRLRPLIAEGRFDPPWVRDLAAATGSDEAAVRQTLRKSAARGDLHQIVRDLFYTPERVDELAAIARSIAERDGRVDAARYRDAIGLGRKRTVQILEFFDRVGYTRRVRDTHVLRGDGDWPMR